MGHGGWLATGRRGDSALVPPLGSTLERASGASEAGLGTTKEVLGFIIDFDFNLDFLGFPILLLGFPRISIRILPGF